MPEKVLTTYDNLVFDELKNGDVLEDKHIKRIEDGIQRIIEEAKVLTIKDIDTICENL